MPNNTAPMLALTPGQWFSGKAHFDPPLNPKTDTACLHIQMPFHNSHHCEIGPDGEVLIELSESLATLYSSTDNGVPYRIVASRGQTHDFLIGGMLQSAIRLKAIQANVEARNELRAEVEAKQELAAERREQERLAAKAKRKAEVEAMNKPAAAAEADAKLAERNKAARAANKAAWRDRVARAKERLVGSSPPDS